MRNLDRGRVCCQETWGAWLIRGVKPTCRGPLWFSFRGFGFLSFRFFEAERYRFLFLVLLSRDAAKNKALLDKEKARLDAEYKQSQIDKNRASATKSLRSGGTSWRWTSSTKLQSKYFDIETESGWTELNLFWKKVKIPWKKTKKSVQGSYNPITWDYTYEGKKVVPLKSGNSTTPSILTLNNPWFVNK